MSLPLVTLAIRDSLKIQLLADLLACSYFYYLSEHMKYVLVSRVSYQDRLRSVFRQSHFDNFMLPVQV